MRRHLAVFLLALSQSTPSAASAEILWDTYGVPHIFAKDNASLFRAFGYAQMESHGDLILRLYGQARGRAAEYWGTKYLASDRWVWTNGIPARADAWYGAQSPEFRRYLDAFADGMNAYARVHADRLAAEVRGVLPVTAADVLAHVQRVLHYTFVSSPGAAEAAAARGAARAAGGSNAWAIAPKRTAAGHAMLLANPHLPWDDLFLFYEAEWSAPGVRVYGATLVGWPQLAIGFNDHVGWTHTVNPLEAQTIYELTPVEGGYRYDGGVKPFETTHVNLKVRQDDGSMRTEDLTIRRSVYGPVVLERNGKVYALAVAGLDSPRACEEWWEMGRARDQKEFEAALSKLQIPMFNVVYADRAGHILYVFNGDIPVRSRGDWDYWGRAVPGDTSATLWSKYHRYAELPRVTDSAPGWLQNTNDPPWTCTWPAALEPDKFPPYMSSREIGFRTQRSCRMLREESAFTLDKLVADKYSTRSELADRVMDELVAAARKSDDAKARQAAEALANWDRSFDAESKGALLFTAFALNWMRGAGAHPFAIPWNVSDALGTPKRIADPAQAVTLLAGAADVLKQRFGGIDVPWGNSNRLVRDAVDLPGNGASGQLGIFRVIEYTPLLGAHAMASAGDSFIAAVEFSNPVQARVLIGYGNSSQPGSKHRSDQLHFAAERQLRPAWITRAEVEKHVESRDLMP